MVDTHIAATAAGLQADAAQMLRVCRNMCQRHRHDFAEAIPCSQLTIKVCDLAQKMAKAGQRPWRCSLLLAAYDEHRGLQLFKTEPSGNLGAYRAVAVGSNAGPINEALAEALQAKQMETLDDALRVAIRLALLHGGGGVIEIAVVRYDASAKRSSLQILTDKEVDEVCARLKP